MITNRDKTIKSVRDLKVYSLAFNAALEIFTSTKFFPKEEQYSLTDQVRRSSRSVCSNLSEGWHKRKYIAAFLCKLTDSLQEASETQTWLDFSLALGYLDAESHHRLHEQYEHIIAQLITMERKAESFIQKK